MTALAVLGGQYRLDEQSQSALRYRLIPWAVRAGHYSKDLMCLHYEQHFEVSLLDRMVSVLDLVWWIFRIFQPLVFL